MKTRDRIKELELDIFAYIKAIDYHKSSIAVIEHEMKKAQEEVIMLNAKIGRVIDIDTALLKIYKTGGKQ
jgi:hypothetical protein